MYILYCIVYKNYFLVFKKTNWQILSYGGSQGRNIKSLFSNMDKFPPMSRSGVVPHNQYETCCLSAANVGKTIKTLHERFYGLNKHFQPSTKSGALLSEHVGMK